MTDHTSSAGAGAHTPGPWEAYLTGHAEMNNLQWIVTGVDDGSGENIPLICEVNRGKKDAFLIAAAPALLKALKAIVALENKAWAHRDGIGLHPGFEEANAAIALAEGER